MASAAIATAMAPTGPPAAMRPAISRRATTCLQCRQRLNLFTFCFGSRSRSARSLTRLTTDFIVSLQSYIVRAPFAHFALFYHILLEKSSQKRHRGHANGLEIPSWCVSLYQACLARARSHVSRAPPVLASRSYLRSSRVSRRVQHRDPCPSPSVPPSLREEGESPHLVDVGAAGCTTLGCGDAWRVCLTTGRHVSQTGRSLGKM